MLTLSGKEIKQEVESQTEEAKNPETMMKNIASFVNDAIQNGKNQNEQHKIAIGIVHILIFLLFLHNFKTLNL